MTMITLNSTINIKMNLMKATLLRSTLFAAAYELKEKEPYTSKLLSDFERLIQEQLDQLDFTENEKLVDKINKEIAKDANK